MLVQGHKHGTFVCGFDRFRPRPSRATNVAPGVGHSTTGLLEWHQEESRMREKITLLLV